MKKTTIALLALLVSVSIVTAFSANTFKTSSKSPAPTATEYYWFDITNTWLGRRGTVEFEMFLTGFDQSPTNPHTIQTKGWAPDHVSLDSHGVPYPNYSQPDVVLYSHP